MRLFDRLRRCALALLLVALAALPAVAVDRNAFSFSRYDLRLILDPHQHSLAVEGTIELRNITQQPQFQAVLQISSSLQWLAVRAANNDSADASAGTELEWLTQSYTSDIDHTGQLNEAIVKLPQPLAPGQSIRLRLRYAGTIPGDTTRLQRAGIPSDVARRSDWDRIGDNFTALRGVGFVAWYPVSMDAANLSQGNELFETLRTWREREATAGMHLQLSRFTPEGDETKFLWLTNGVANSATNSPANTVTSTLTNIVTTAVTDTATYAVTNAATVAAPTTAAPAASTSTPAAPTAPPTLTADFPGVDPVIVLLIDPAEITDRPQVEAYFTAAHTEFARDYVVAAEAVVAPLAQWFGDPKRKVVLVELTDPDALPYDLGSFYFVPMRRVTHAAAEVALARPVVHAMFDSPRPWIREGLANFGQALIRERQAGRPAALEYLGQFASALQVAESQSQSSVAHGESSSSQTPSIGLQPLITTADEIFFRTKAAYVWWMLRDMAGDRVLQSALSRYRPADDRDTGYVQRLIEERLAPHRDLEPFFDDWVYRDRGLPQLHPLTAYVRKTLAEQTITAVTVENLSGVWCEVPIAVRSAQAENVLRLVLPAKSKATLRIPFDALPTEAIINDGSVPEATPATHIIPATIPTALP